MNPRFRKIAIENMTVPKLILTAIIPLIILLGLYINSKKTTDRNFSYQATKTDNYQEYSFDSGEDRDMGFTHRALDVLRTKENLLDQNSATIKDISMKYVQVSTEDQAKGIYERRRYGTDIYELRATNTVKSDLGGTFEILKNGKILFEKYMAYGGEGSVIDWRIVDGRPAFTYSVGPGVVAGNIGQIHIGTNIYYDGEFMNQKYDVDDPRYLFSYHGKLGFIAKDNAGDRIFFDGKVITPAFDAIHYHNCCSYTEILPTVYENGTLLFYGQRDIENYQHEKNYVVEVKL